MTAPLDRIPHRAPWLLVDRVIVVDGETVRAEKTLTQDDPLLSDGFPEVLCVEALAQTAACLNAGELGAHRGYLVAATGFSFEGRAQAGEILRLEATRTAQMGALLRFDGVATAIGSGEARIVARGSMTFAVEK
jgi:3-hydroxymyristoyl/3-hydroxydecanoyl-(acyl carrier protein) dehydratase